ncbi:MAG: 30S ribosomal protein S17 [Candidatus Rokuibacteriota bacterium]
MSERKTREAVVISDKMQKTRVVRIERVHRHPRYERVVRTAKRLKVHDEANESRVGDRVLIEETRPLSKEKRWRIRQIVKVNEATRASNRPPAVQAGQALR